MSAAAPPAVPAPAGAGVEPFLCAARAGLTPAEPGPGARGPGRPRVLPAPCLWAGLRRSPRVAAPDPALYHRLARDGAAPPRPARPPSPAAASTRWTR